MFEALDIEAFNEDEKSALREAAGFYASISKDRAATGDITLSTHRAAIALAGKLGFNPARPILGLAEKEAREALFSLRGARVGGWPISEFDWEQLDEYSRRLADALDARKKLS